MISSHAHILIERPVEAVFAFVAQDFFVNYRRWSPEIEHLEVFDPGPIRLGSTARQVRVDHGRRTDTTFEVIALEPLRHLAFEERDRQRYRIRFVFAPAGPVALGGGAASGRVAPHTRLDFACELKPLGLMLRPFEPLVRAAIQDGAEQAVRRIKRLME